MSNYAYKDGDEPDIPLSAKALRFVSEYAKDFNIKAASVRAGYSPGSYSTVLDLMRTKRFKEAFNQLLKDHDMGPERTLAELRSIAFANLADCFTDAGELKRLKDMDYDTQRAIANWGGESFTLHSKLKALEMLGKAQGLFDAANSMVEAPTMVFIKADKEVDV